MPTPTFDFKALAEYVAHLESKAAFVDTIVTDRDRLFKRVAELELKAMGPLPDEDPIVLKAQIARLTTALERIWAVSDDPTIHMMAKEALNPEKP
jgi:hypothetical protein